MHQTWKTRDVPQAWRTFQESWRRQHPSWGYMLWTDDESRRLIAERHPWFLPTYDAFPRHIQRVDAAKYFILYTHGGVYADLDCECLRPVEPLTHQGGAVVGRTRDGIIEGAFLASPAGHPLWEVAFREMQSPPLVARALHRIGYDAAHVLFSTGPHMLRRAVRSYVVQCAKANAAPGITIWEPKYFSSRSWLKRYERFDEPDTFLHHHYSDSWLSPGEAAIHKHFTAKKLTVTLVALVLLGLITLWASSGRE